MSNTGLREYELILVLDESEPEALETAKGAVDSSFEKRSAQIKNKEDWGSRKLFHEVKHIPNGHFYYYTFSAPAASISQINQDLRMNTGVLKSLIHRIP